MLVKSLLLFAIALFLTYPASILTTIIEGQSAVAIYSYHLPISLFSYFILALPVIFFARRCHPGECRDLYRFRVKPGMTILAGILILYSFLVFWGLNSADIVGDDYDLAYQAYNLQDGIAAARKAFVISYNTHPPLFMSIKHYWFQLLFPNGLETVPAWGYRGMEGILGIATILAVYAITKNYWATALLAINNYMVFLGRVYLREMYLTFFITLSIYFFQKRNYLITAFLVGCGLLIKTSTIVVLPVYILILLYRKEFKNIFKIILLIFLIYFPLIIYNLFAFVTTGNMDATFSKIFGLSHPFLTGSASSQKNLLNLFTYLSDIHSLPVFIVFIISVVLKFDKMYFLILLSSFLFYVLGGPLREYYLLFLTIPFVILAAKLPKMILIPVLIFSFWYSISDKSYIRKIYEPSLGWPQLVHKVSKVYRVGDCLEKGNGVNDLNMRAYFQTDDTPKKVLLGTDYSHYYKMCEEVENPQKRIKIYYHESTVYWQ